MFENILVAVALAGYLLMFFALGALVVGRLVYKDAWYLLKRIWHYGE